MVSFQRLDLLLVAHGPADDLVAAVAEWSGGVRGARMAARVAVPLGPGGFDALVSVGGEGCGVEELTGPVAALAGALDGQVDAERSAVIAGRVDVVIDGDGPVFVHHPLRRLPGMTVQAFQAHWSSTHAALARAVPGLAGYRQLHADVEATLAAGAVAGVGINDFVGAAEGRRPSRDAPALARGPELEAVLADERSFIDATRCGPTLYQAISGAESFGG